MPLYGGERHGIARLDWLQEAPTDPLEVGLSSSAVLSAVIPRHVYLAQGEVEIEVARALIEELHDAITFLSRPQFVVKGPE